MAGELLFLEPCKELFMPNLFKLILVSVVTFPSLSFSMVCTQVYRTHQAIREYNSYQSTATQVWRKLSVTSLVQRNLNGRQWFQIDRGSPIVVLLQSPSGSHYLVKGRLAKVEGVASGVLSVQDNYKEVERRSQLASDVPLFMGAGTAIKLYTGKLTLKEEGRTRQTVLDLSQVIAVKVSEERPESSQIVRIHED